MGFGEPAGVQCLFCASRRRRNHHDHLPVNEVAKIPDDRHHPSTNEPSNQNIFDHWHTHRDDMRNIDPNTLKAVGQTLLQALYQESL
ncbi:MAG: M28 family peptidase [Spirosomataceae bacterium]